MITKSKQNWQVGEHVRVGFLTLKVLAIVLTPRDFRPDEYLLTNDAGDRFYSFTPHLGLDRLDRHEARELLTQAERDARAKGEALLFDLPALGLGPLEPELPARSDLFPVLVGIARAGGGLL